MSEEVKTRAGGKRQRLQLTHCQDGAEAPPKKKNLFRDVIPTTLLPNLHILHRDRVNGLPEQVVNGALFGVERLVHAVLVCAEPRRDFGKEKVIDRVQIR